MPTTILLANEPRAYREALEVALRMLRPHATVIATEPDAMDEYIHQHSPQIVVCSQLTAVVESNVPTWALIYPDGASGAVLQIGGQQQAVNEIDLEGIIALLADKLHT
jgi:acetyl-CoA carboxylase alpha subunit